MMNDRDINKMFAGVRAEEKARIKRFGNVKSIIHANAAGRKFIAVGDVIYHSDHWNTFIDFLFDYLLYVLGKEWFEKEIKKSENEQHPVMQWRQSYLRFHKKQSKGSDGFYSAVPSGPMMAYLTLSYDLYLLYHNHELQELHVRRLKNANQFQGARYELFVTTSMIRAGFNIQFEDETDPSSKHVEFQAVHKKSGEVFAIEAKSKHRAGVLGYPGKIVEISKTSLRFASLINKAIDKEPEFPYLIFVDLNMHPWAMKGFGDDPSFKKIAKSIDKIKKDELDRDRFTALIYTNQPYHYGDDCSPRPPDFHVVCIPEDPIYPMLNTKLIEDIRAAIEQHKNIPSKFDDG